MGYPAVWKVLEEIVIELRKKGVATPQSVMNDLKSAKVLMKIMDASQKDHGEIAPKVEQCLGSVEAYLVMEAQKFFEPPQIDEWLRRLKEASCDTCVVWGAEEKEEAKFVSGVPTDQKWIRVEPIATLPLEKLKQLAEKQNLSSRLQEDGRLLVYGKAEDLKAYVKEMTEQTAKE